MAIGDAVRLSRLSRNLSQSELGVMAGLSRQAIGLLEASGGKMSSLAKVCLHAPISISHLPHARCFGDCIRDARQLLADPEFPTRDIVRAEVLRALRAEGDEEAERFIVRIEMK